MKVLANLLFGGQLDEIRRESGRSPWVRGGWRSWRSWEEARWWCEIGGNAGMLQPRWRKVSGGSRMSKGRISCCDGFILLWSAVWVRIVKFVICRSTKKLKYTVRNFFDFLSLAKKTIFFIVQGFWPIIALDIFTSLIYFETIVKSNTKKIIRVVTFGDCLMFRFNMIIIVI